MSNPRPETLFAEAETLKRLQPDEYPWVGDVVERIEAEVLAEAQKRFPHTPTSRLYQYVRKGVSRALRSARRPR